MGIGVCGVVVFSVFFSWCVVVVCFWCFVWVDWWVLGMGCGGFRMMLGVVMLAYLCACVE